MVVVVALEKPSFIVFIVMAYEGIYGCGAL